MTRKVEILALVAAGALCFMVGRDSRTVTHESDKHDVDSLGAVITTLKTSHKEFLDSVYSATLERDGDIKALQYQLADAKSRLATSGKNATDASKAYVIHRTDTVRALADCDTLANAFAIYKGAAEKVLESSDSIIDLQARQIEDDSKVISRLDAEVDTATKAADQMKFRYDGLYKDYRKKTNWWNRWGKTVVSAVIGGFIVHTIMK